MPDPVRILVVGQTPPPFGGQAVMIQKLIEGHYPGFELILVRMGFSREMSEIGLFRFAKLFELASVVGRILRARIRYRPAILYYPPAGPNLVPFLRDVVLLTIARRCVKATLFHFHASGVSTLYPRLNPLLKAAFWLAYRRPEVAIRLAENAPDDGGFMQARTRLVLPLGIEDQSRDRARRPSADTPPVILFVGVLKRTKGVMVLLEACRRLKERGRSFRLVAVGQFESPAMEREAKDFVRTADLGGVVEFPGVLLGAEKWRAYEAADIFCFPSYFDAETFPVVLLEAMMWRLPVVASRWKGIPAIVQDGRTGFLVEPERPDQVCEKLACLCGDPALRLELGDRGRERYVAEFSREAFESRMGEAFRLAASTL